MAGRIDGAELAQRALVPAALDGATIALTNIAAAWRALERANIASQPFAGPHVAAHVSRGGAGAGAFRMSRKKSYVNKTLTNCSR